MEIQIAVDLMGRECSPQVIFEAMLILSRELLPEEKLIAIAQHAIVPKIKKKFGQIPSSISFISTEDAIHMEESPLLAVRRKKNSSLSAGMRLLKEKKVDAFVSTGNTGALVASAMLHLPMLPKVERPALLVMMPTETGSVTVLDVGANVSPKPRHLVTYAQLGSIYSQKFLKIKRPKIGLLNIGVEEQKGTKELKEVYQLLQEQFPHQFFGNIEGREVFQGKIDVLITDGFTGNVFLKTTEGISTFLAEYLQRHFQLPEIIAHLHQKFNYAEHPGALLCGVDGIVIKCHGFSNQTALINGIKGAFKLVNSSLLSHLKM